MEKSNVYDVIVAGSGMGGMSTAALLANEGYRVLVLEAAHALGGCSSSYYRQGYWFESGATTLIGFDEHQPLRYLEDQTGITIPKVEIQPVMEVRLNDKTIKRYKNRRQWIQETGNVFGNTGGQRQFWELAYAISDTIWRVSLNNHFFPPVNLNDWIALIKNNHPKDIWVLPYALQSVESVVQKFHLDAAEFMDFIDEQLMITAQSTSENTPFLFGAVALTYTNYSNYYVPGGLIRMVHTIRDFIQSRGGVVKTKSPVRLIEKEGEGFRVHTSSSRHEAAALLSNIPVWNMPDITVGKIRAYFEEKSSEYEQAWGAFTMGVVTEDTYPEDAALHHQLHLNNGEVLGISSQSIFVSMSHPNDRKRSPDGKRVLNVSTHTNPDAWFIQSKESYEQKRQELSEKLIDVLDKQLPGFQKGAVVKQFSATPLTWENWVYRKKGKVGGIPQSMGRALWDWMPAETPFEGLFLCGDTVFPGQGIPGVTLSGINAYHRILRFMGNSQNN